MLCRSHGLQDLDFFWIMPDSCTRNGHIMAIQARLIGVSAALFYGTYVATSLFKGMPPLPMASGNGRLQSMPLNLETLLLFVGGSCMSNIN